MFRRLIASLVCLTFIASTCSSVFAQEFSVNDLPVPGTMVSVSPSFKPALIRGLTVHQDNPFLFDFIVDPGQSKLSPESLRDQSERMIKYFFASLTLPDTDVWVNLSPYEKDRMIPVSLGETAMGRDLLAQDYMLKQLTASLIYPQDALGKTFWERIYAKAKEMYGTTQIPVNTFNKVWIVPQKAGVYEHGQTAYIVEGHLKVMLEEDYLSMTKHNAISNPSRVLTSSSSSVIEDESKQSQVNQLGSQIIRAIILPEIEKEINEGENFSTLRQIFYAQVLAVWFKRNLKEALLNQVYADKSTVKGIDQNDKATNEAIYHQYLKAYKKGVFNFIKEDIDPVTQETLPRKYFSGGYAEKDIDAAMFTEQLSPAAAEAATQEAVHDIDFAVVTEVSREAADTLTFKADAAMFGLHHGHRQHHPPAITHSVQQNPPAPRGVQLEPKINLDPGASFLLRDGETMAFWNGSNLIGIIQSKGISANLFDKGNPISTLAYSGGGNSNRLGILTLSFKTTPNGESIVEVKNNGRSEEVVTYQRSTVPQQEKINPVEPSIPNSSFKEEPVRSKSNGYAPKRTVITPRQRAALAAAVVLSAPIVGNLYNKRADYVKYTEKVLRADRFIEEDDNPGNYESLNVTSVPSSKNGKVPSNEALIETYRIPEKGRDIYFILHPDLISSYFTIYPATDKGLPVGRSSDIVIVNPDGTAHYTVKIDLGHYFIIKSSNDLYTILPKGNLPNLDQPYPQVKTFLSGHSTMIDVPENLRFRGSLLDKHRKVSKDLGKNPALPVKKVRYTSDLAMVNGGIDLSQEDAALHVEKDANGGVKVNVDQALIARIEREGMPEVVPVIINMQPADIQSLFGVGASIKAT